MSLLASVPQALATRSLNAREALEAAPRGPPHSCLIVADSSPIPKQLRSDGGNTGRREGNDNGAAKPHGRPFWGPDTFTLELGPYAADPAERTVLTNGTIASAQG